MKIPATPMRACRLVLIAQLALFSWIAIPRATAAQESVSKAAQPLDISEEDEGLRRCIADRLVRLARSGLLTAQDPQPVEYRYAASLLAIARSLVPGDPELIRLEMEARSAGLQPERVLELARELIRAAPDDEVAQLRLALEAVRSRQDAPGRLEAYELLLSEGGSTLRPPVRSRLALDAALLAREQGDESGFVDYITLATTLDPSNKEAAAIYASHFLGLSDDPLERFDVLTNVILADPLDPAATENLAIELMRHGAFEGADRVIERTIFLLQLRGEDLPLNMRMEIALAEWNVEGTQHVIAFTQRMEEQLALQIASQREYAIEQGLDPGPETPALLPPQLETIRLAAGVVAGEPQFVRRMMDRLIFAGQTNAATFRENFEPEEAERRIERLRTLLLWARLFSGERIEEVRPELDRLSDPENTFTLREDALQRFEGWLALHEGDDRRARELLEPLVTTDRHARWALATLEQERGDPRIALIHYAHLAQTFPNTAIGTAAWFRAQELYDGELVRSEVSDRLSNEAISLMDWLITVFPDPNSVIGLDVRHVSSTIDPAGSQSLRITVRNRSSWVLAMGEAKPIPVRLLATPIYRFGTGDLNEAVLPETVSIPGRLRLGPGEEYSFITHMSRRLMGDLTDLASTQRSTARWQFTLGYAHDGDVAIPVANAVTAQTELASVRRLPSGGSEEILMRALDQDRGLGLARTALACVLGASPAPLSMLGMEPQAIVQRRQVLLGALTARLAEMTELERCAALLALNHPIARLTPEDRAGLRAALDEVDPMWGGSYQRAIQAATLRLTGPDDPLLDALRSAEERWARDLAQAYDDIALLTRRRDAPAP